MVMNDDDGISDGVLGIWDDLFGICKEWRTRYLRWCVWYIFGKSDEFGVRDDVLGIWRHVGLYAKTKKMLHVDWLFQFNFNFWAFSSVWLQIAGLYWQSIVIRTRRCNKPIVGWVPFPPISYCCHFNWELSAFATAVTATRRVAKKPLRHFLQLLLPNQLISLHFSNIFSWKSQRYSLN